MSRTFSSQEQAAIDRLISIRDEDIDTDDISGSPVVAWFVARRSGLDKARKTPVTVRLDADVVEWFKPHAQGRGYQTDINSVLRRHVAQARG